MAAGGAKKLCMVESDNTIFVLSVGYGAWRHLQEGQEYDPDKENSTSRSSLMCLLEKWSWKTCFLGSGVFCEKEHIWQLFLPEPWLLEPEGGGGEPALVLLVLVEVVGGGLVGSPGRV